MFGEGRMSDEESGAAGSFSPKPDLLTALLGMGVTQNAAIRALYFTGNYSADLAAAWIFENQDDKHLNAPLDADTSSDEGESSLEGYFDENELYKMVLVVNSELQMGVGKIGAQCAHAALGLFKQLIEDQGRFGEMLLSWEQLGETKIVLKADNTGHIVSLAAKAAAMNLPHYIVQDAGKTQVPQGSTTVLAIIGKVHAVNQVSGSLSLL